MMNGRTQWLAGVDAAAREAGYPLRWTRYEARGPRTVSFWYALGDSRKLNSVVSTTFEEAVALRAGVDAVRVVRRRGSVVIEFPLPRRQWRSVYENDLPVADGFLTMGMTTNNNAAQFRFPSPRYPHALVSGTTGCGKTTLLRYLLFQTAARDERVLLIDAKGGRDYQDMLNISSMLARPATTPDGAQRYLAWLLAEMDRRKSGQSPVEPLLVVIDEVAELVSRTGGKDGAAAQGLASLAQVGRGLGISLVLGTQYPLVDVIGGSLAKANLPLRVVGRLPDAHSAQLAAGMNSHGVTRLTSPGEFLIPDVEVRATVPLITPRSVERLPRIGQLEPLDTSGLDLAHVVDVACPPAEQVGYAIGRYLSGRRDGTARAISATAIREQFGGGMSAARRTRDYAQTVWNAIVEQYPEIEREGIQ